MKALALFFLLAVSSFASQVPVGHGLELTGFSDMGTDVGYSICQKGKPLAVDIAVPLICVGLDGVYRFGEKDGTSHSLLRTKFAWDVSGVALGVVIHLINRKLSPAIKF